MLLVAHSSPASLATLPGGSRTWFGNILHLMYGADAAGLVRNEPMSASSTVGHLGRKHNQILKI